MKNLSLLLLSLLLASCGSIFKKVDVANSNSQKSSSDSVILAEPEIEVKGNETIERHTVFFDTDSFVLTKDALNLLDKKILPSVKDTKARKITIEGYCDERGSRAYNNKLGKKRALSVKEFLVKNGIKSSKVRVKTYGESNPVDLGHNESAWAKNRRAITVIVKR